MYKLFEVTNVRSTKIYDKELVYVFCSKREAIDMLVKLHNRTGKKYLVK